MLPQKVLRQFDIVPPNPSENDFHGPYNKLLHVLFPADTDFVIVPQYIPVDSRTLADRIFMFEVYLVDRLVFILELNSPSDLNFRSKRQAADSQIRQRMADLVTSCPLNMLYAVSVMGTALSFYFLDTQDDEAEIIPAAIPRHPTRMNDTAPANRWGWDLLQQEGVQRFCQVVDEIKAGCEALGSEEA